MATDTEELKKNPPLTMPPIAVPAMLNPLRMSIPSGQAPEGLGVLTAHQPDLPSAQRNAISKESYSAGMPRVTAAPFSSGYFQQREAQNQYEHAHPWGSDVSAHPGIMGKIGHVLGRIGNIAGNALTPGVMAEIPGTDLNRRLQSAGNEAGFQKAQQEETEEEKAQNPPEVAAIRAQGAAANEASRESAQEHARQEENDFKANAQKEHEQFLADMEQKKTAATPYEEWAANPQVYEAYLKAQAAAKQAGKGSMMSPYAAVKLMDYAYMYDPRLLPFAQSAMKNIASQLGMPLPAGIDISTPPVGQPVDESGTPIGLRQPGAPTGATRGRGQFAESVIPGINDAKNEIAKLGNQLGPMSGRWNDLYTGKLGVYGPQFSGLQTTLKNIGTAWMRLHANSEKAREDFEAMLKSSQDPANLISNLDSIEKQAQDYVQEGKGRPNKLGGKKETKGPQVGEVRTINGQKAKWDGKGWVAQ